jgi:hypothetical protein
LRIDTKFGTHVPWNKPYSIGIALDGEGNRSYAWKLNGGSWTRANADTAIALGTQLKHTKASITPNNKP